MKVRFWGVRGGMPAPGPDTVQVGGNTPCVEVRTSDGQIVIFDAGTGIRALGDALLKEFQERIVVTLFISHTHWDHIQGFPFFNVHQYRHNRIMIIGEKKVGQRLDDVMAGQLSQPYSPFGTRELEADLIIKEAHDQETIVIGQDVTVKARSVFHPGGALIFRIDHGDHSVVYATDVGHPLGGFDQNVLELAQGCDVLIHDAQFSEKDKTRYPHWGHSTWREAAQIGKEAKVGTLVAFHHSAWATDDFLRNVVAKEIEEVYSNSVLGHEGLEIDLE